MFQNIGRKIRGLAKGIGILGVTVGVILALIGIVHYLANGEPELLTAGVVSALGGLILSWLLYGYGEIVENTAYIAARLRKEEEDRSLAPAEQGEGEKPAPAEDKTEEPMPAPDVEGEAKGAAPAPVEEQEEKPKDAPPDTQLTE